MPSIIGSDLKIVGNLSCDSDIDVQGTVEGDIEAKTVTVDKDARVDGSIRAGSVVVSGVVDGKLEASEISLTSTSRVTGELLHDTLSVDPGARLEARLSRISQERRIAAQIPKPKLETRVSAPSGGASAQTPPPGAAATAAAVDDRTDDATDDRADDATGEGADGPERRASAIPEVFDRRKKQATG